MGETGRQHCVVCAWREHCNKKFSVVDGGSHCPDFTRDVTIKAVPDTEQEQTQEQKQKREDTL